jgi:hypothetical protein
MIPELQVYYDFSKKPPPEVLSWLEEMGVQADRRSSLEAPPEWLQRYGCCFPWVVIEGRIQLKAGFKKSQLERLLRRWKGAPKLGISIAVASPREAFEGFCSQIGSGEVQEFLGALAAYYCHRLEGLPISKTLLLDSEKSTPAASNVDNKSTLEIPAFGLSLPDWEVDRTSFRKTDRFSGNYFLNGFRGGHGPIVQVHPDCEGLTPAIIEQALVHLRSVDVVVGSTTDGDCYLLGLRSWHEALFFSDSDDASIKCLTRIKAQAQSLGLSIYELPTLPSIQSRDDLERLAQGIREQRLCEESRSDKVSEYLLDVCDRILRKMPLTVEAAEMNNWRQGS